MTFFYVIQNIPPDKTLFVESTISGYCIFTKWESRAKLFSGSEAEELVQYLINHKPKNYYAKIQKISSVLNDPEVSFKISGK